MSLHLDSNVSPLPFFEFFFQLLKNLLIVALFEMFLLLQCLVLVLEFIVQFTHVHCFFFILLSLLLLLLYTVTLMYHSCSCTLLLYIKPI